MDIQFIFHTSSFIQEVIQIMRGFSSFFFFTFFYFLFFEFFFYPEKIGKIGSQAPPRGISGSAVSPSYIYIYIYEQQFKMPFLRS